MAFRFATAKEDYSDFASGKVFFSMPGQPAFPVRLISEIFQRCLALRQTDAGETAVSLYDPCCGSAYHLGVLGFLHRPQLAKITASDIDPETIRLATRNLSLLTVEGLAHRRQSIANDWQQFGKQSHREALDGLDRLANRLAGQPPLPTRCFTADATAPGKIAAVLAHPVDFVISDLPYGQLAAWRGAAQNDAPVWHLLEQLRPILHERSVVALATAKGERVAHEGYRRYGRFRHGKRLITFLKPIK